MLMKHIKFSITLMHVTTCRKRCMSIIAMLYLKKNIAHNVEEKNSASVHPIITSNNIDNDITCNSKKSLLELEIS